MKVIVNTGYNRIGEAKDNHLQVGGIVREIATHVKRFLDLYQDRNDISMRVCLPLDMWEDLITRYPFVVCKSVEFLDYEDVLKKQGLEKNIYWYDALRFQVFSTIEENKDVLEYWVDEDALIFREDFIDLCLNNPESIVIPRNYYCWDNKEVLERLKEYSKYFQKFGLDTNPKPDLYTNTGTIFGGPSKYVKLISSKILEVERSFKMSVHPSAEVLEYTSCYIIGDLCKQYNIPLVRVEDIYTWHWTGYRLPGIVYEALRQNYPEDVDKLWDWYNVETEKFRLDYIIRLCTRILKSYPEIKNTDSWVNLAVEMYSDYRVKSKLQKFSLI